MDKITKLSSSIKAPKTYPTNSITITDNRTGKHYQLPIYNDSFINANDLLQIKTPESGPLRSYDPGYLNTMSCTSSITFIDGGKGILQYRGIPIEQLAEKSTFLETAYLLIEGNLPTKSQLNEW